MLVVAQLDLAQPDGSRAAAAALASLLPPFPAANGTAELVSSNRYARLLSQQAQAEWRLPPAAPGFNSSLLRQPELPDLVASVLAVANSTNHTCPWDGLLKKPEVSATKTELLSMLAQTVPGLEEQRLRRERMAVTAAPSSSIGWRGRWAAFSRGAQWSLGSWIEWGLVQLLRALRSQAARAVAGPGELLGLLWAVHGLCVTCQRVLACLMKASSVRRSACLQEQHRRVTLPLRLPCPCSAAAAACVPRLAGMPACLCDSPLCMEGAAGWRQHAWRAAAPPAASTPQGPAACCCAACAAHGAAGTAAAHMRTDSLPADHCGELTCALVYALTCD